MDRAQKLIFIAGLVLILAGLLFGLGHTYYVNHGTRLVSNDSYEPVFSMISDRHMTVAWQELQQEIHSINRLNARAIDVHTHSINMGILVLMLGLMFPLLITGRPSDIPLLLGFVTATWIYPIGLTLQMFELNIAGEIIAALGACLATVIFILVFFRVSKSLDSISE